MSVGDTWEWNGRAWSQIQPVNSPSARYAGTMVYDPVRQVTVLFGGAVGSATGATAYNDTWEWDGTNWTQMQPAASPPPRYAGVMVFDSLHNVAVLFGGYDPYLATGDDVASYINDTWTWDGTNWTQQSPATSPGPRAWASMSYDSIRNVSVVFGGNSDVANFDDTWTWDGANWTQQTPTISPPQRIGASMVFDPAVQASVLIGGTYSTGNNDTWLWDGSQWTDASSTSNSGSGVASGTTNASSTMGASSTTGGEGATSNTSTTGGAGAATSNTSGGSGAAPQPAADAGACAAGLQSCGGGTCDTDLTSDPNNCGGCGIQCVGGAACISGTCVCSGATPE